MRKRFSVFVVALFVIAALPSTQIASSDAVDLSDSAISTPVARFHSAKSEPSRNIDFSATYDSAANRVVMFGGWNVTPDYGIGETWSYDLRSNTFANMQPGNSPSPRLLSAMAYDSQSYKTVLFGGFRGQASPLYYNDTWVYDHDTNQWTQLFPNPCPPPRATAGMSYDFESDRIILFGGYAQGGIILYDDTWAFDVDTNTWEQMSPSNPPPPRGDLAMDYDQKNDRMIMYGGYGDSRNFGDLWSYDYNSDSWVELTPSYGPSAFSNSAVAYDNESDVLVLFGGNTGTEPVDEVWHYDFTTNAWTHFANPEITPFARHRHQMVYDSQSDLIVLIGGGLGPRMGASAGLVNDTLWTYDTNSNHWRQMSPSYPQGRGDPLMTYDSDADRVLIHGGWITTTIGDTWSYDFNSDSFYNMAPNPTAPTRQISAMEYDSQSKKTVMFSGLLMWPLGNYPDDTWIYDYSTNNWTEVFPAISPVGRGGHRMAYDSESDRIIMFGGRHYDEFNFLDDTWAYDVDTNTWELMSPSNAPSPRWYHSMTYDVESDRVILFGGWEAGPIGESSGETWAYDYNTDTWEELTPSTSPPPRGLHTISYDNESDRIVLFGGNDGSVDFGDTWIYDFNTNSWTESTPHPHPSKRHRAESVYDSESDRIILYGGIAAPYPPSTHEDDFPRDPCWSYDVNSGTWTLMAPNPGYVGADTDRDSDELPDLVEFSIGTNPDAPDTDMDLMPDGWEYYNKLDPLSNDALDDSDSDGLTNLEEFLNNADPHNSDSDFDTIPDGLEVHIYNTSPTSSDSDNDLMPDAFEVNNGLDPLANDTFDDLDGDGLHNYYEYQIGTSPQNADSDSDLASDGWEVLNGFDPLDATDGMADPDQDGLLNYEEESFATNPFAADSDGDGFSDLWEARNGFNPIDPHVPFVETVVAYIWVPVGGLGVVIGLAVLYRYRLYQEVRDLKRQLAEEQEARRKAVQELVDHANSKHVEDTDADAEGGI